MSWIWEIVDEFAFASQRYFPFGLCRLYRDREKAEEIARKLAERVHGLNVKEMVEDVQGAEEGLYDETEIEWWNNRPPLVVTQEKDQTFYGVGDPNWSTQDRRGARYGFVVRRWVCD